MPLEPAPPGLSRTRDALHAVAEQVLAPARVQATGNEIALQARSGGVGTPDFPDGGWLAFAGGSLLVGTPDGSTGHPLTSLRAAGLAAGLTSAGDLPDDPLSVDVAAADFLGSVFAFAEQALLHLRAEATASDDASPIRLWPEHFDIAYEQGDEAAGKSAGYGVSPGDELHPEPYAYVTPWAAPQGPGDLWNATAFTGAELSWSEIVAAEQPDQALLRFWRVRRDAIA
jgi:hypothetical protein